jgi:hypothetical protein
MRTAMQNLHERWGLSTAEIARALDITERVARLARDGSEPSEEADRLDDFLTRVHESGVEEPGTWMSEPVVEGYTATRWMLYVTNRIDLLLSNARGEVTDEALLASLDPDWRARFWTSFTTFVAEDGTLSTRGKTYDEVRAQV